MNPSLNPNLASKDAVIIFGCGYVGTALASCLKAFGVRVGALTRNMEAAQNLRDLGLDEVIEADLDSRDWHDATTLDYSYVVNCVSSAGGGLSGYEKSYFDGQHSILDWVKGKGGSLKRYIYTSSTSVYPQDGGVLVDESVSTDEAPETGKCLVRSEKLLSNLEQEIERWYVLRLAGIYGPTRQYMVKQLVDSHGAIPGRGDYTMNMIHRDDVVGAVLRCLSSECLASSGVYNITDDDPRHKVDVVQWIADELGLPTPDFDPGAVSSRLKRRGGRMPDRIISNQKAKKQLGWKPIYPSFKSGLSLES